MFWCVNENLRLKVVVTILAVIQNLAFSEKTLVCSLGSISAGGSNFNHIGEDYVSYISADWSALRMMIRTVRESVEWILIFDQASDIALAPI